MTVDILVADDERINLKLIEGILRDRDLNLVSVTNGEDALKQAEEHDFAVALLDVMMPGMDGFEVAEKLRNREHSNDVPIIFITAISKEQQHVFRGYELGAVDYLFKPVEPEVLRGKVAVFAELHRHKRTLEQTTLSLESTVKALEASRKALERSEERYRMVADYNYDWESWIGPDGSYMYVSPSCERISGYPPGRFLENPDFLARLVHREDLPAWENFMLTQTRDSGELDFRIHHKNTRIRWIRMVKHAIQGEDGVSLGVRTSMRDVTNRKYMEEKLKHSMLHDPLTGLPNRSLFLDRVSRVMERSLRTGNCLAVLFINLDRFQAVNDNYGHSMGDKVLVRIGTHLRQILRPEDTLARFGGDEFVILIDEMPRKSDVRDAVKRIQRAFDKGFVVDGVKFTISASMGLQIAQKDHEASENVVHNAQLAMYKAKGVGKNHCVEYTSKMREGVVNILAVENELKRALKAEEFETFYQAIVNLADGTLYGFEALARWRHPEKGLVSPGEFIPVAEETGLIIPLGALVLRDACNTLKGWQELFPAMDKVTMAVNISAKQFAEAGLIHDVKEVLGESGLSPECLKLEITETVVMLDAVESSGRLNRLKGLGLKLAIDDFGTGYSSMSYLQKFPVDQLKIDLSFVRRMEKSPENIEIIRAIVNMAHSLRLKVVAEGIETDRQRDLLYSLQCDYGQGYLYSRPVPAEEAENLLRKFM